AERHNWRVDVLHLSPPCQPFSAANTTPNEARNEMNTAPLLGCSQLIQALRPRIVTVEEAPGLYGRHKPWFNTLINQFTELGFSVAWTNLRCSDFGVPQQRRRFIIIAAAPGETIPRFPRATHDVEECSIAKTLAEMEAFERGPPVHHLTYHDTTPVFLRSPRGPQAPYNALRLAKTLTTSGGDNYHPLGFRPFSIREQASLQTFPFDFEFALNETTGRDHSLKELRTQIGNAVPPKVSAALYRDIIKGLRKADAERLGGRKQSVVEID
ncbi:hypothetical protein LTR66_017950, partial [Elasticomyces elasticus]